MKQSRGTSLLKSIISTAVGFAVAYVANMLILPWFGLDISHSANVGLTTIYTFISIARGFALERAFEAMGWRQRISPFASAVLAERQRQQDVEGWSTEHDDRHDEGDLASAGACYASCAGVNSDENRLPPPGWPWEDSWWKPQAFRRDLVKGAALIIAEGDKFDRQRRNRRPSTEVASNPWPHPKPKPPRRLHRPRVLAKRPPSAAEHSAPEREGTSQ